MNLKNLAMWGIIVLLSVGLFNMFQNPDKIKSAQNKIAFSTFLTEVENGRVVEIEIKGKNINGVLTDGKRFNTIINGYQYTLKIRGVLIVKINMIYHLLLIKICILVVF